MQKIILSFILFKAIQTEVIMKAKKFFLVIVLSIFVTQPSQAYKVKTFQPLQIAPLQVQNEEPTLTENYPKITQLEINIFKRTFERESIYKRLARLEHRLFKSEYPNMPLASRVENILANVDAGVMYNISEKELAKLEIKILARTYPNDDTESRITRLEKEMLGAMQSGNIKDRFETIRVASKHYNSYPEIVQSQNAYQSYGMNHRFNSRGFGGFMQNFLGAILGNMNTGAMTGYTPPIYDPYNPYAQTTPYSPMGAYSGFMNPGIGQQEYYTSNTRSYLNNKNYGSQASVRILD